MKNKFENNDESATNLEKQKYLEFTKAMDEESRIIDEMNKIFDSTSDRAEAEKIVLDTLAEQMDAALQKSKTAQVAWLETMKENRKLETE